MSQLARPDLVKRAICSGLVYGYIEWKPACLERFRVDASIPEQYRSEKAFQVLLRAHVCTHGNPIKVHKETDPNWLEAHPTDPWLYSVVMLVPELESGIYAKMKLLWGDGEPEDDANAQLISVHKGLS